MPGREQRVHVQSVRLRYFCGASQQTCIHKRGIVHEGEDRVGDLIAIFAPQDQSTEMVL